jgi:hypothetical protein
MRVYSGDWDGSVGLPAGNQSMTQFLSLSVESRGVQLVDEDLGAADYEMCECIKQDDVSFATFNQQKCIQSV